MEMEKEKMVVQINFIFDVGLIPPIELEKKIINALNEEGYRAEQITIAAFTPSAFLPRTFVIDKKQDNRTIE